MQNELKNIELSIVVLAYKSEDFILPFLSQLQNEVLQLNISFEFIVVANYDKGDDNIVAEKLFQYFGNNPNYIILKEEKKGRMGWDMRSGLNKASGHYIAVIDGDGQMPASDIPLVYNIIKNGDFDLVKTYRKVRYDGFYRKVLSTVYNILFNFMYTPKIRFKDINSKPKILQRSIYQKMNLISNDWFTDAEIMIEAIRLQLRICEIGTVFYKKERESSLINFSTVVEFVYNLIKYKLK